MATFLLEIVTPDKTVAREDVEMVICPGSEGEFGILPNHVSLLSALKLGALRYKKDGKEDIIFISGGFVDMHNNLCSVLAESAERADSIDVMRAKAAQERAQRRLAEKTDNFDKARAEFALQRAMQRLQIAEMLKR